MKYCWPVGGSVYNGDAMYQVIMTFMQEYFVIAFRIALPIFISIVLCNVILGVLAKIAPQMNMFSIGIELKLLLGLMVMVSMVIFLPNITDYIYGVTKDIVVNLLNTMH